MKIALCKNYSSLPCLNKVLLLRISFQMGGESNVQFQPNR